MVSAHSPSSSSSPDFTQVQLSGPPAAVDQLMTLLADEAEVIFDSQSEPDAAGQVQRVAHLVTHSAPRPVSEQGVSVTVQTVLEAESSGAFSGLPGTAAAQEVGDAVAGAVAALPQVRQASSRVISAWGLPETTA